MSDKFQVKAYAAKEANCSCKNSKATSSFFEQCIPSRECNRNKRSFWIL